MVGYTAKFLKKFLVKNTETPSSNASLLVRITSHEGAERPFQSSRYSRSGSQYILGGTFLLLLLLEPQFLLTQKGIMEL